MVRLSVNVNFQHVYFWETQTGRMSWCVQGHIQYSEAKQIVEARSHSGNNSVGPGVTLGLK